MCARAAEAQEAGGRRGPQGLEQRPCLHVCKRKEREELSCGTTTHMRVQQGDVGRVQPVVARAWWRGEEGGGAERGVRWMVGLGQGP